MTTPLQLARVAALLANRGQSIQPRLLLQKEDALSGQARDQASMTEITDTALGVDPEGMERVIKGPLG